MVSVYGIDRGVWDHPDFPKERFTQREAWLWLIGAAAYQEKRIRGPRGPVTLQRGEFCFALSFLAQKWLWNKATVHRFIQTLKSRNMIANVNAYNNTVYLISNYNKFQIVKAPKRNADLTDDANRSETTAKRRVTQEKDSKDSKDSESLSPRALRAEFDEKFWPVCPKKVGKESAFKAFCKARKTAELEPLVSAMRGYALERAGLEPRYTAHPTTWLNAGRWADEAPKSALYANGHDPPQDTLESIIARARTLDQNRDKPH